MTSDDLIRQVATEIKQNVYRATMEEALDAAKAVLVTVLKGHSENDYALIMLGAKMEAMRLIVQPGVPDIQEVVNHLAEAHMAHLSATTGEDYQILSTAPQIVEEIIDPEVKE